MNKAQEKRWASKYIDTTEFGYIMDNHLTQAISCGVKLTGDKSTSTTVHYVPAWDEAEWQHGGVWWTVGDPTKLFVPYEGYYIVFLNSLWESNTTGFRQTEIYHQPSGERWVDRIDADNGHIQSSVCMVYSCDAGDHFTSQVYQDSGGNLDFRIQSKMQVMRFGV